MDNYKNQTMKNDDEGLEGACWEGYEAIGMKEKNGKKVPNCVPKDSSKGMAMKKVDIHENERVVIKSADGVEYVVTQDGLHHAEAAPAANVLKSTRTKRGAEDYIRFRKLSNAKVVDTTTLKGYGAYMGMPEYDMGYHIIEEEMMEPMVDLADEMEEAEDFGDVVAAMQDAGYVEMGEYGVTLTEKWHSAVSEFVQDALSTAAMKSSEICCDKKDLVMLSYRITKSIPENADFGYKRPEPQAVSDAEVANAEQNGSSGAVNTDSMPPETISESEVRTSTYKSETAPENAETGHERRPEEAISDEEVTSAAHNGASGSTDTADPNMAGDAVTDAEVETATHLANHNRGDSGVTHDEMSVSKGAKNKKPDADGDGVPDWADEHPGEDDHEVTKGQGRDPEVDADNAEELKEIREQEAEAQKGSHRGERVAREIVYDAQSDGTSLAPNVDSNMANSEAQKDLDAEDPGEEYKQQGPSKEDVEKYGNPLPDSTTTEQSVTTKADGNVRKDLDAEDPGEEYKQQGPSKEDVEKYGNPLPTETTTQQSVTKSVTELAGETFQNMEHCPAAVDAFTQNLEDGASEEDVVRAAEAVDAYLAIEDKAKDSGATVDDVQRMEELIDEAKETISELGLDGHTYHDMHLERVKDMVEDDEAEKSLAGTTFKSLWEAKAWSNPNPERYEVVPTSFWDKKEHGLNKKFIVKEKAQTPARGAYGNKLV